MQRAFPPPVANIQKKPVRETGFFVFTAKWNLSNTHLGLSSNNALWSLPSKSIDFFGFILHRIHHKNFLIMSNKVAETILAGAAVVASTVGTSLGAVAAPLSPADFAASAVEATVSKKEDEGEKTPVTPTGTTGS